ncbi:RHS repeat domain-containing protein [Luteibacter rhizovicinus]|uniref:RHS repeat domain-containing protein n=1 Tax=Luteibacter rhizovicinus TaxID=242606 RepID=UPI00138F1232|nr:RHS repeat domain-containing protein [Luteibacter rhizovicinus]
MRRIDVASRSKQHHHFWVVWLLCGALLSIGAAEAPSIHYVYDANDRVVVVTSSDGTAAKYTYNALGHKYA